MIFKTIVINQLTKSVKVIYNDFRHFCELHTRLANDIINNISKKKKRTSVKQSGYVYVINQDAADTIASFIAEDWKGGYILEANPGPGILSRSILQNGINKLRLFEKNKDFLPALEVLSTIYPSLEIVQEDLMLLPSIEYKTTYNNSNYLDIFFQNISELSWENGIPFQVFIIISSKRSIKFLRYLLAVLPMKSSIFSFGRCEFFLLTTETEYMYMKAAAKENFSVYRWSTVLCNLFFEIKYLKKFSPELFLTKNIIYRKKMTNNSNNFHLLKLTPKADLFSNLVTSDKLTDFYFFVRHHFIKRRALVIPTLEGWIPLCGPRLIKQGMNVFTKFGDLSPTQILLLFNQFSSWPEYEDSAFQAAAHKFNGKEQFSYEEDHIE